MSVFGWSDLFYAGGLYNLRFLDYIRDTQEPPKASSESSLPPSHSSPDHTVKQVEADNPSDIDASGPTPPPSSAASSTSQVDQRDLVLFHSFIDGDLSNISLLFRNQTSHTITISTFLLLLLFLSQIQGLCHIVYTQCLLSNSLLFLFSSLLAYNP